MASNKGFYLVMGGGGKYVEHAKGSYRRYEIKTFHIPVGKDFLPTSIARIPQVGLEGEFVAPKHSPDFRARGLSSRSLWYVSAHDGSGVMVDHGGNNFAVKVDGGKRERNILQPGEKGFVFAKPGSVVSDEFGGLHAIVAATPAEAKRLRNPRAFCAYLVQKGIIKLSKD